MHHMHPEPDVVSVYSADQQELAIDSWQNYADFHCFKWLPWGFPTRGI